MERSMKSLYLSNRQISTIVKLVEGESITMSEMLNDKFLDTDMRTDYEEYYDELISILDTLNQ